MSHDMDGPHLRRSISQLVLNSAPDLSDHDKLDNVRDQVLSVHKLIAGMHDQRLQEQYRSTFRPISARLLKIDENEWKPLLDRSTDYDPRLTPSRAIYEALQGLQEAVRDSETQEVVANIELIAYLLLDDLVTTLEEKSVPFFERAHRPWAKSSMQAHLRLAGDLRDQRVNFSRHDLVSLRRVLIQYALDLSRLLFDFERDPDSLYAIRIQHSRKNMIGLVVNQGLKGKFRTRFDLKPDLVDLRCSMDHTVISITASFDRLEYVDNGVTIGTKLRQILRNLHSRWRTVWAGHAPWDAHLKTGLLINQCLLKTISLGTQKLSLEYVEEIKRDIETIIKETKVDAPQLVPSMNLNVHVAASPGGAYPARQILPSINYHRQNEYYPPVSYNTASSSLSGYHPPPPSFLPYQQMAPNQHGFNPNVASFVPGQGQLPALNPENPVFIPGNRAAPSPYVLGYPPHDPQYPQQPPYYR